MPHLGRAVRKGGALLLWLLLIGCRDRLVLDGGVDVPPEDSPVDPPDVPPDVGPPCSGPPGLYIEGSCSELAPGVRSFVPRYALWSDGADKERFVYLPPGTQIDTTDPDAWVFPVGTIFWKTFSRDGLRIETRINEKVGSGVGPDAWSMRTYAWSADQLSVMRVNAGVIDALGTGHDIPATAMCSQCHSGAAVDVGLGFSAIQLNHEGSEVSLADLNTERLLSAPIALTDALIPGDDIESAALGYLHSNCGPCHGGASPQPTIDPLRFWIDVGTTNVAFTGPYLTAVSHTSTWSGAALRIAPGSPETSAVTLRMDSRMMSTQMPPIATELRDADGLSFVRAWIRSL